MKLEAFSVFDSKVGAYLAPFFLVNEEVAKRAFSDCVNDKSHAFNRNAADYHLFYVGSFDDVLGAFSPAASSVNLGCALTFLRVSRPDNLDLFPSITEQVNK